MYEWLGQQAREILHFWLSQRLSNGCSRINEREGHMPSRCLRPRPPTGPGDRNLICDKFTGLPNKGSQIRRKVKTAAGPTYLFPWHKGATSACIDGRAAVCLCLAEKA
ncbi:hypothetical protein C8J56DRAFT_879940 [Mycena floridula]|nr:hypothetical protein C8J56DRAFT_879940 [Mycena floridula]